MRHQNRLSQAAAGWSLQQTWGDDTATEAERGLGVFREFLGLNTHSRADAGVMDPCRQASQAAGVVLAQVLQGGGGGGGVQGFGSFEA